MWLTGIFVNPVKTAQILTVQGGFQCLSRDGTQVPEVDDKDVEGPVVTGGCCTKHVIKGLCRASWAIGGVAAASTDAVEAGVLQWVVRGPV